MELNLKLEKINPNFASAKAHAKFARRADRLSPNGFKRARWGNPDGISIAKFGIKGLTLLEIIISVGIFALVASTATLIFNRALHVYRISSNKTMASLQAQTAMEWIVRDIESANMVINAGAQNISMFVPNQGYVNYFLNTDQTIRRKDCTSPNYLLAKDVTRFNLNYYDITNGIISSVAVDDSSDIISGVAVDDPRLKDVEVDITTQKNNQPFRLNSVAKFNHDLRHSWFNVYGVGPDSQSTNDVGHSIVQTSDGGFIFAGFTYGSSGGDVLVVKVDRHGDAQWAKIYGGTGSEGLGNISVRGTSDGGIVVGCSSSSFGTPSGVSDFLLIKADSAGIPVWAKTYRYPNSNDLYFTGLEVTADGGYFLVGSTTGIPWKALLIKVDASGTKLWAKTYAGDGLIQPRIAELASGGGCLIGAVTQAFGTPSGKINILLIKTNELGVTQSAKHFIRNMNDDIYSLLQISGGYILTGHEQNGGIFSTLVIKINGAGEIGVGEGWAKTYRSSYGRGFGIDSLTGGGYIIAGVLDSYYGLLKIDPNGTFIWAKTYPGMTSSFGATDRKNILELPNEGYIAIKTTRSFNFSGSNYNDFAVFKADLQGEFTCCSVNTRTGQFPPFIDITSSVATTDITTSYPSTIPDARTNPAFVETDFTANIIENSLNTNTVYREATSLFKLKTCP